MKINVGPLLENGAVEIVPPLCKKVGIHIPNPTKMRFTLRVTGVQIPLSPQQLTSQKALVFRRGLLFFMAKSLTSLNYQS